MNGRRDYFQHKHGFPCTHVISDITKPSVFRSSVWNLCETGSRWASVFNASEYLVGYLEQLYGRRKDSLIHLTTHLNFNTIIWFKIPDNLHKFIFFCFFRIWFIIIFMFTRWTGGRLWIILRPLPYLNGAFGFSTDKTIIIIQNKCCVRSESFLYALQTGSWKCTLLEI